jgi:hypothetical protein
VRVRREEDDDAQQRELLFIFFFDGGWTTTKTKTENVNFSQLKTILDSKPSSSSRVFQLDIREQRERESREREGKKSKKMHSLTPTIYTLTRALYDILFTWLGPPLFVVSQIKRTHAHAYNNTHKYITHKT